MGQGLEVECWGLKPAGDRVAWMKSTQQPLHVGLRANVPSCSCLESGRAESGRDRGAGEGPGQSFMTPVISAAFFCRRGGALL